jgi:hypothetical protein
MLLTCRASNQAYATVAWRVDMPRAVLCMRSRFRSEYNTLHIRGEYQRAPPLPVDCPLLPKTTSTLHLPLLVRLQRVRHGRRRVRRRHPVAVLNGAFSVDDGDLAAHVKAVHRLPQIRSLALNRHSHHWHDGRQVQRPYSTPSQPGQRQSRQAELGTNATSLSEAHSYPLQGASMSRTQIKEPKANLVNHDSRRTYLRHFLSRG